ncbi:nucleotidyltransferase family protein [Sphingomonas sp. BN140010]|uniref:Nucleotidyltransferase family protein n=1 Tax=Sphingomonas arvum TaxID=2992113 RepID=A0ABT3JG66_9SPHN|nr:nucleotidyltransferase family protein [Sphingomonas sp. BN140010]MCW3797986.1 nucleotidyltransferase family protein [Sphingomonas sp. BN140010]
MGPYTAVLLAGSRPGGDPLSRSLGVDFKPLLPVAGEPMVLRPLRALLAAASVGEVLVLTQETERLAAVLPSDARVRIERSGATLAATLTGLLAAPATRFPLLVTTADHALLTPAMVEEFVVGAAGSDLAIGVVSRTAMLRRFPDAQRTWLRFGRERYSGANLFALNTPAAAAGVERWRSIEQDRKKGWRVLLQMGWPLFLGAVLRVRDIHGTAAAFGRRLGLGLSAVVMGDPLAAIDVDKPADHELVTAILEGRA